MPTYYVRHGFVIDGVARPGPDGQAFFATREEAEGSLLFHYHQRMNDALGVAPPYVVEAELHIWIAAVSSS